MRLRCRYVLHLKRASNHVNTMETIPEYDNVQSPSGPGDGTGDGCWQYISVTDEVYTSTSVFRTL